MSVTYGFGDAAKHGFGRAIARLEEEVRHEHGIWSCRIAEEKHSNYKELRNLVEAIESWAKSEGERCRGTTVFMFTDNTVVERAYFRGNSSNRELFELVYRLRMISILFGIELHVIHISGTRMIDVGVDGLSRGQLGGGV